MYLNILLEKPSEVCLKNKQLFIDNGSKHHFPLEDINTLVLGTRELNISGYCLEQLAANGTTVIVCGEKHQPTGILLPFANTARRLPVIKLQFQQAKPVLKRLWQQIIRQKIINQGHCLQLAQCEDNVTVLADRVRSGDSGNVESTAAVRYFRSLFGDEFHRREDDLLNAMLNYGYAILRACLARTIAAYGLEPSVGIFHHSELNSFNLADDLIEPFRPAVDLCVVELLEKIEGEEELNTEIKRELIGILQHNVIVRGQKQPVNYAIELLVQSLLRCYREEAKELLLPQLCALEVHEYE